MTPVLVGIDSGGTRTSVRIRTGEATHGFELAESLSGSMAPTEHAGALRAILRATEDRLPPEAAEGRIAVFVGAAGFTPALRDEFRVALGEVAPTVLSGRIASIGIANDATTLLLGHHADAIVIAGTGSNVLVRSSGGAVSQVGGQEWVVADQGSGFWIGLRGIRRAYGDHEAGAQTVLLHRLREAYGVPADDDARLVATVRDLAIADAGMKRRIARFRRGGVLGGGGR